MTQSRRMSLVEVMTYAIDAHSPGAMYLKRTSSIAAARRITTLNPVVPYHHAFVAVRGIEGRFLMSSLPPMLKQGERARLFPVLADTSREGRMTSIFLAILPSVPELAQAVFGTLGVRVGKRTKIETFTEIVLNDGSDIKNRPDGLIMVSTAKSTWTALVEAKIGKAELDADQVTRYIEVAKANKIDAVLTISNQFVARADVSPLSLPRPILKKADLFHWSWTWLKTQCEIISYQERIEDQEQQFLLTEFLRLLGHPSTGVERFTQMGSHWKDMVQAVSNQDTLKKTSTDVEETIGAWFQELRDLSLLLSSHVGQPVSVKIDRKLATDASERLKEGAKTLAEENRLHGTFNVPDGAADIDVCADLMRRSILFSMKLKAPQDKKSTKARINWLLRMLKEDDPRLWIKAHWPGRKAATQKEVSVLREDPDVIDPDNSSAAPHSLEVLLIETDAKRFAGRRTFIETMESSAKDFYGLVGQHLRAWQPPPPKPVRSAPTTAELAPSDEQHGD